MRPTRLLLTLVFFFLTVSLTFYTLLLSHPRSRGRASSADSSGGVRALFSWRMPSGLFPQSAIVSLTDDNSTFFLSRPANYGPRLPTQGLSGQLWIGSGFSDDAILRGGATAKAEGELGCSDIPGWDPTLQAVVPGLQSEDTRPKGHEKNTDENHAAAQGTARGPNTAASPKVADTRPPPRPNEDDGTDDFLHWPLKDTALSRTGQLGKTRNGRVEHADIQSLQESAEIAGKVVLLSRGGCGFLEKTKWVQRRGGLALIVGDNVRGGPLTTMFAGGDASNISIPSVFTTRTTAHLLSSLIPPKTGEGIDAPIKGEELAGKSSQSNKEPSKGKSASEKPESLVTNASPRSPEKKRTTSNVRMQKRSNTPATDSSRDESGWAASLVSRIGWKGKKGGSGLGSGNSRPPSSGRLNWVASQDWDEDLPSNSGKSKPEKDTKAKNKGNTEAKTPAPAGDSFVIGVQDWRDPEMMKPGASKQAKSQDALQDVKGAGAGSRPKGATDNKELTGGSHTPGSGVYHQSSNKQGSPPDRGTQKPNDPSAKVSSDAPTNGWFGRIFGSSEEQKLKTDETSKAKAVYDKTVASSYVKEQDFEEFADKRPVEHEGLWVTITPTTMSATPFFDALLVLVVSPLVTLTVVYALLLLRSRIRRRRWRAPKSVVDRLPVRTYHTINFSSASTSSHTTSPGASSPTSPLLRTNAGAMLSRTRPRSRTTSVLAEEVSTSLDKATAKAALSKRERNRLHPKKYKGQQVECVVCLEEYIDGQSRVMSLPCGHEFHAECITPWLTTRRRTCPICKGDVVRSLASASSNSSSSTDVSAQPYRDVSDSDDVQAEAALTRNESPSAAIPIPQNSEGEDLERGDDLATTLVNDRREAQSLSWNWREIASRSLSTMRGDTTRTAEDRNR